MDILITLVIYVALYAAMELLRPKPKIENARPAGLGDFSFPTATEGRKVPIFWGTVVIEGPNVVWYGDLSQDAIKQKVKTGLFSSDSITKGYRYNVGIQFALCRGPIDLVKKVWIGDTLVFSGSQGAGTFTINKPTLFGGDDLGTGGVIGDVDVFIGTTTQSPSDYLAKFQNSGAGTTRTPRYIGECYLVFRETGVTASAARGGYIGNSTSIKPWKFELQRIPNGLNIQAPYHVVNSADANLMNVLFEVLTNTEWGWGYPTGDVDTANLAAAGVTLALEGNGLSMMVDREMEAEDLIKEIERQAAGVLYEDPQTGKFKFRLMRADYDPLTIPEITEGGNLLDVEDFSRGQWQETTNHLLIEYNKRVDDYKLSYATAGDPANAQIQGGGTVGSAMQVTATSRYPGVKDGTLADQIAWRDLRTLSQPLARARFRCNREMWATVPGDVVAWTSSVYGFTRLPMRVQSVSEGDLDNEEVILNCVQDHFRQAAGSQGAPPGSGWSPPTTPVVQIPSGDFVVFESPRGLVTRAPAFTGQVDNRIWCGARRQGVEVSDRVVERHSSGTPAGAFATAGEAFGFLLAGQLAANLGIGSAYPLTSLTITASPDARDRIVAAFPTTASLQDIGTNLLTLLRIDEEFILCTGAQASGSDVQLNNLYRGVLDSVQAAHSSGAKVYLMFVGGVLTDTTFADTDNVHVKLLPRSRTDLAAEAGAVQTALTMAQRVLRPIPPSRPSLNGTNYAASPSLEGAGAGLDGFRIDLGLTRRDFRATDEIQALTTDAAALFGDFPTANSTIYEVELRNDPAGTNALLFVLPQGQPTFQLLRRRMIRYAASGVVPSSLRLIVRTYHNIGTTQYQSRQDLTFDFTPTSGLTGQFAFGSLAANTASASYTAAATGTFTLNIGTAFGNGNVEVSLNGGAFASVIAAGLVTGTFAATSGDGIRVRHTSTTPSAETLVELKNPSAVAVAYGVLYV